MPNDQHAPFTQAIGYATAGAVDLAQWHDVVMSAMRSLGVVDETKLTPANLEETYQLLPDSLKAIADEWSLSDTVFRDEAYEWLVAHLGKSHNKPELSDGAKSKEVPNA